jgi:hypothetical protein
LYGRAEPLVQGAVDLANDSCRLRGRRHDPVEGDHFIIGNARLHHGWKVRHQVCASGAGEAGTRESRKVPSTRAGRL